jgi:hypothetical protein
LTITVGGNDITDYVQVRSIYLEEVATDAVALCEFDVRDHSGTVGITEKDAITIDDDGTTLFSGEVVDVEDTADGVAKEWHVICQDNNILLDEVGVSGESYAAGTSDADIIDDLFTTYLSAIDSTTHVSTLDASMEAVAYDGMLLREVLDDLASRTGARYYVDYDKNFHWFSTEAEAAAFDLSTSPDYANTYPFGGFRRIRSAAELANRVYVKGKEVSGWVEDAASVSAYGERETVSRDQRITTAQGVTDRGEAILAEHALPKETYELHIHRDGLRAGMSIDVTHETWGLSSETLYIRELRMTVISDDAETRRYDLILGSEPAEPARTARTQQMMLARVEDQVNSVSDTVFDTDAPSAPNALGAGNISTGVSEDADGKQIVWAEVTWSEVTDSDLDHYEVQLSTQSDFSSDVTTRVHPAGGDRSERFTGLLGNTTYYVRVRAEDWTGNDSAWDYGGGSAYSFTSAADSSAPAQVSGLSAASSRTLVGLSWDENSEADLAYYEIQRADDSGGSPGAWSTIAQARLNFYVDQDFTNSEVSNQDTFWYRVRAVDTSGNAGSWAAQTSTALGQITTDHIAANTITANNIAANTITAGEMNVSQLSAIAADMGSITAGTITGATIRTAASGARVVQDSTDGIRVFNASDVLTAHFDVDGSGQIGSSSYEPIVWNSAGEIDKIKANQIDLGDAGIFSEADGLLLLGPNCPIDADSWTSLRGQEAEISGAFHTVAGPGTRALMVEEGTTNLVTNPRAAVDTADWGSWTNGGSISLSRDTDEDGIPELYSECFHFHTSTGGSGVYSRRHSLGTALPNTNDYTITFWAKTESWSSPRSVDVDIFQNSGAYPTLVDFGGVTVRDYWQRFTLTASASAVGDSSNVLHFQTQDDPNNLGIWITGVQLEQKSRATSYCDGSLGAGYSWSGTAHQSQSTRSATSVTFDPSNLVDLSSGTIVINFQMPYDAGSAGTHGIFRWWDAYNTESVYVELTSSGNNVSVYSYTGSAQQTSISVSLSGSEQGDWHQLVVTFDSSVKVYLDGELAGTDSTYSAPSISSTTAYIGQTVSQLNGAICQFASLGSILTAEEVAALYHRDAPLVDTGAHDAPGLYILDGRFSLATSTTGARTRIDGSGWYAYDAGGDAAFGLALEDGVAWGGFTIDKSDLVLGHNKAGSAAILWDQSEGTFDCFGDGDATKEWGIGTDGAITAGGGTVKISRDEYIQFFDDSSNEIGSIGLGAFTTGIFTSYDGIEFLYKDPADDDYGKYWVSGNQVGAKAWDNSKSEALGFKIKASDFTISPNPDDGLIDALWKCDRDGDTYQSGYAAFGNRSHPDPAFFIGDACLYANSDELIGMDDAGNKTTLTPHTFDLVEPSEPMAWCYHSKRGGRVVEVDMMRLARLVEKLSGEQLVYIEEDTT